MSRNAEENIGQTAARGNAQEAIRNGWVIMRDELRARGVHSLCGRDCSVGRQSAENDFRASVRSLGRAGAPMDRRRASSSPPGSVLRLNLRWNFANAFRRENFLRIEYGVIPSGRHFRSLDGRDPRSRNSTRIRNPIGGDERRWRYAGKPNFISRCRAFRFLPRHDK